VSVVAATATGGVNSGTGGGVTTGVGATATGAATGAGGLAVSPEVASLVFTVRVETVSL